MEYQDKPCPLMSFAEASAGRETLSEEMIEHLSEVRAGALEGDALYVYSYGLMLHRLAIELYHLSQPGAEKMYGDVGHVQALPDEVQDSALKRAFDLFSQSAGARTPDGDFELDEYTRGEAMLMTAWCKLTGIGTDPDPAEAQIWFDGALQYVHQADQRLGHFEREMKQVMEGAAPKGPRLLN